MFTVKTESGFEIILADAGKDTGGNQLWRQVNALPELFCTGCRMPSEVCSVGLCPDRFTKPVPLDELT